MTPLQRAEKIAEICGQNARRVREEIVPLIAAQIEEACAEAYREGMDKGARNAHESGKAIVDAVRIETWNAAREKAKGIALGVKCELHEEEVIAARIDKMEPDL